MLPPDGTRGSDSGQSPLEGRCSDAVVVRRGLKVKLDRSFARLAPEDGWSGGSADDVRAELSGGEGGVEGESSSRSESRESVLSSGDSEVDSGGQVGTQWGSTAGDLLRCNPLFEVVATSDSSTTTSEDSEC